MDIFDSCVELAVARHMFGMLNQNVHWTFWLKTGSDPEFCEKRTGQSPWSNHSHLVFRAMAAAPSASAAVPPEGEMEVDFGPVEPEDEEWQVVHADQEAQALADALADFLTNNPGWEDADSNGGPPADDRSLAAERWCQRPGGGVEQEPGLPSPGCQHGWVHGAQAEIEADGKLRGGYLPGERAATHPLQADPDAFSKLVMFPESFPSIPNYILGEHAAGHGRVGAHWPVLKVHGRAFDLPGGYPHPSGLHPDEEHVRPGGGAGPQLRPGDHWSWLQAFEGTGHWHPVLWIHVLLLSQCFFLQEGREGAVQSSWGNFAGGRGDLAHRPGFGVLVPLAQEGPWMAWRTRSWSAPSQLPPVTSTSAELTMAGTVDTSMRLLIRDEILQQDAEDDKNLHGGHPQPPLQREGPRFPSFPPWNC